MTIEINKPELEALIRQYLQSGEFHDIDELFAEALGALREKNGDGGEPMPGHSPGTLRELFEGVRGLADDVDLSRNPSTGRPVDLA